MKTLGLVAIALVLGCAVALVIDGNVGFALTTSDVGAVALLVVALAGCKK